MNMKEGFDIPVVLILFKRKEKPLLVLGQIAKVKPKKLYLLSDGGRTPEEMLQVEECRRAIESAIDWDCEVVKRYAESNIGVYENIAGGAKWVFEREEFAIFLEDDNFPELSFFKFCEILLKKYEADSRVFWICGTNYFEDYNQANGAGYMFTQCMLPCGWASWSDKFLKYYDSSLDVIGDQGKRSKIRSTYFTRRLYKQDLINLDHEVAYKKSFGRFYSWDYQMAFSIRVNNLLGVVPCLNQIKNIGVDSDSIHGGWNEADPMTARFCNLKTKEIQFPIVHPEIVSITPSFERDLEEYITDVRLFKFKAMLSRFLRRLFNIPPNQSLKKIIFRR